MIFLFNETSCVIQGGKWIHFYIKCGTPYGNYETNSRLTFFFLAEMAQDVQVILIKFYFFVDFLH